MLLVFIAILILSFILAIRSMNDLNVPKEVSRIVTRRKVRGTIVVFKNKVKHFKP